MTVGHVEAPRLSYAPSQVDYEPLNLLAEARYREGVNRVKVMVYDWSVTILSQVPGKVRGHFQRLMKDLQGRLEKL